MRAIPRKWVCRAGIVIALLGGAAGAFFAYRSYKIEQVDQEARWLVEWLKEDVLRTNPVRLKSAFGRKEPAWLGATNLHFLLQTPTGAEFTVNALIESSITGTKLTRLDLYYAGGPATEDLTVEELAEALQHPQGKRVELPVEIAGSGQAVDLKKLLPEAFVAAP